MKQNVSQLERALSLLGGGIALFQVFKKDQNPLARAAFAGLAGGLLFRGSTGHCPAYAKLDIDRHASETSPRILSFDKAVVVNRTVDEVRNYLTERDTHLGRLTASGEGFHFEAGDSLWNLSLESDAMDRTVLRLHFVGESHPKAFPRLAVKAGEAVLKPAVDAGLRKIKALIETGEIATIDGQSNGVRSTFGSAIEGAKDLLKGATQKLIALPDVSIVEGNGETTRKEAQA